MTKIQVCMEERQHMPTRAAASLFRADSGLLPHRDGSELAGLVVDDPHEAAVRTSVVVDGQRQHGVRVLQSLRLHTAAIEARRGGGTRANTRHLLEGGRF